MKKVIFTLILTVGSYLGICQTTLILQPDSITGKDAMIWSKSGDTGTNKGNINYMGASAWTWNGVFGTQRMLVDFDLTAIPAGATITAAELSLYYFQHSGFGFNGDNALYIKRITSPWDESTVTWDNKPSYTDTNEVSVPAFTMGNSIENLDVTALVTDMVADQNNSHGFLVMLQTEATYRVFNAATSEHTDSSLHPKLVIHYYSNDVTGLKASEENELALTIFPNPYSDNSVLNFHLSDNKNLLIEMVNSEGKTIKTFANTNFSAGDHTIELNKENTRCPGGLYLIRVVSDNKVYSHKLIIKD
jgi:hypothetical protein